MADDDSCFSQKFLFNRPSTVSAFSFTRNTVICNDWKPPPGDVLLWIADSKEGVYYPFFRQGLTHRMLRQNHQTLVALAAWFSGRYFSTHYGMAEGREWMEASTDIFKGTMGSFKPVEDANAYQWTTLDHLLTYSLASGDRTCVENGNCRRALDQAVFYCNNRGALPAFGDTSSALGGYPTNFLMKAGHLLQDGRAATG